MKRCEVVWVIRHSSICHTFVDEGAAVFFLPHLRHDDQPGCQGNGATAGPSKRMKYVSEEGRREGGGGEGSRGEEKRVGSALGPDWQTGRQMKGKSEV